MTDKVIDTETMTQADFARRRGVSRATVSGYKAKGYLVMTDEGNKVKVAASEEKLANMLEPLRGGNRSSTAGKPSANKKADGRFMTAKTEEVEARAARARLELQKEAGKLVDKERVAQVAYTLARTAQEAFVAIPDRISTLLAAEDDAAKVHEMLSTEIRAVCQGLAKGVRDNMDSILS